MMALTRRSGSQALRYVLLSLAIGAQTASADAIDPIGVINAEGSALVQAWPGPTQPDVWRVIETPDGPMIEVRFSHADLLAPLPPRGTSAEKPLGAESVALGAPEAVVYGAASVPEPSTALLLGLGVLGLAITRRRSNSGRPR